MVFIRPNEPALVLAPMDGVTDFLMRELLTSCLPLSYCVSEFVRVSALVPPRHVLEREVPELRTGCHTLSGAPVQVQLLGGDPEVMAAAAASLVGLGAGAIDINFGCPAPTVNRHDGGATLLKFPERIETIVRTVRSAVPLHVPVSAKLRLGWDDPRAIHVNAERACRGGAAWITIHGRTKMQGYTPPAYWSPIGDVRRSVDVPVVANGEIWSREDLERCREETGCIHFMLGRGVLAEPGIVGACARSLGVATARALPVLGNDPTGWWSILHRLVSLSVSYEEQERKTLARIKQWLNYAHHRGTISWFDAVKRVGTVAELGRVFDALNAPRRPGSALSSVFHI